MMKLPENIIGIINSNKTSLGDNPALPPELDDKFLMFLVEEHYGRLSKHFLNDIDADKIGGEMAQAMKTAKDIESANRTALEELCSNVVNEMFQIPRGILSIDMKLVDKVDVGQERLIPERSMGFSFDSITDMSNIVKEIYKRRFLNALITGAAMYYGENVVGYAKELEKIDGRLIKLYDYIAKSNGLLMFHTDKKSRNIYNDGGRVDVYISNEETPVRIKSRGVLFPMLLTETIKGILELAISHGLPSDREKAEYIVGKADFKLAEIWDQRLGIPLWRQIVKLMKDINESPSEVGINFLLMELAKLKPFHFNPMMQELLANTSTGKEMMKELSDKIHYQKERDEFDDYMTNMQQDGGYQINDGEFTPDELVSDELCSSTILDETDF